LGGPAAAALADRRVGKRLDLRGVGDPWSRLDETGGMVGLDGCKRGLARAASWDPFGVLAPDLRVDRAFFVLGDLFADIDFDGQIVSAPLPDADALGVRGGMDCVRGIASLRRYGVCRLHAGAFADALAGGYGVGFMMVLSMAWLVAFERSTRKPAEPTFWDRLWRDSTAVAVLLWLMISMLGLWQRDAYLQDLQPIKPIGRFLLIQGNMPTIFDANQELLQRGWIEYEQTTRRAVASVSDPSAIDVVIWPESIFGGLAPYMQWDRGVKIPEEFGDNRDRFEWMHRNLAGAHEEKMELLRNAFGRAGKLPHFVMGTDVLSVADGRLNRYNAALWIDNDNPAATDFYAKHHLVMFGEYIPVLSWFPNIMKFIGLGKLSEGESPKAWRLDNGRRIAPSICFENMVPHVIQAHIRELSAAGEEPDVLVNLSNDGWFRGSSALDHHLNSAIVAAVENRTPMLISANTGISAWIDGNGRVVQKLDRLTSGWILAEPLPDGRYGWWSWWGDFPARCIAVFGCMPWALALLARITPRKTRPRSDQEILRS
jgi:apolipoprotein N-acyltransferase